MDKFKEIAAYIKEKGYVVAFTGAGISVDSGIPAFRGGQGLWEKYDPMEYAHISAFRRNPEKVWVMLREMAEVIFNASPSPAHLALSELEKKGFLKAVITQNVDGLHQLAGNTNVIEYHGNHRWLICVNCSKRVPFERDVIKITPYPKCERCDQALKPDVVFFGEGIPMSAMIRAHDEANKCRVMFVIGTSGVVYPAADIPYQAKSNGALIVEINIDSTPFTHSITDYFLQGTASEILPNILKYLD
ncbi:MAG TPA: NAD-dependent deacylase [Syntrophorhabdaceae bacterium]|nr:NAD-dependent deacylase [Syntrophorhabdaceae bacterium]HPP05855.1 NAD-dependent deacylase [Syntrophorhabdaceae bacterium]